MAFKKTCVGTVAKCSTCGKPGIIMVQGQLYCEECSKQKKILKKNKSNGKK